MKQTRGRTTYAQRHPTSQRQQIRPPKREVVASPESGQNVAMEATEIFKKYNSAVFMIFTSDGFREAQGSGFFIRSDGLAVSNYHVFEGTTIGLEIIKLIDGRTFKVKEVLAKSDKDDFILFRIEGNGPFNCIPISKRKCQVGEKVYAIGSPRGLENTFSSGEISQIREDNFIQTSCPIDHGSSGGVLLNVYGEAIGITTAGRDDSGANLNFVKDIKVVREALNRLTTSPYRRK